MTAPGGEQSVVRYYCTAGNGMERFLIDEVKRKLAAQDVCQMPGKVLFNSSAAITQVSELKSAERLFLLLKQDTPVRLPSHTNPAKAASVLQARLLGDQSQWMSAVGTWSRLQRELSDRRTPVNTASTAGGVTTRREDLVFGNITGEEREDSVSGRQRSGRQNGAQMLEKKRKRNYDREEEEERRGRKDVALDSPCWKNIEKERRPEGEERGKPDDHGLDLKAEDPADEKISGRSDGTLLHPSRMEADLPSSAPISFRISCKCTGSLSRFFSTQELSKVIGVGVSRMLGWKTDLKNPQLEVNVSLSDDHCLLGIPLSRSPLANRSYIKHTGLRSTVAWAMASLVEIKPGSRVLDPMCGTGTILIEAAQEHKAACFLGVDIDDGQLQKATDNREFAELQTRIHLLKASSLVLPLPSASVDAVVCDLPFGRKFGSKTDMAANLPLILAEMERVLCVAGTLVLLLSPQLSCQLKRLLPPKDTEPTSKQETEPQTRTQDCQIHQGTNSPPAQTRGHQSGLHHSVRPALSSLKHQTTLRVSLGLMDGLIHKYVKTDT